MPILDERLPEDIGKKYLLHAVLFPKEFFKKEDAINWLKDHLIDFIHNRQTKNFYRFRVREQVAGLKFITIKLNNNIQMVYMY